MAVSSCEAEYIVLTTVKEALYPVQLTDGLGDVYRPVLIFEDNQGDIALSKDPVNCQRSKHIDVRYHFIRSVTTKER